MSFNLRKAQGIVSPVIPPIVDINSLDFAAASTKVLSMYPGFDNINDLMIELGLNSKDVLRISMETDSTTLEEAVPDVRNIEEMENQMRGTVAGVSALSSNRYKYNKKGNKMIKPFNLKKAQEIMPPMDPTGINDTPELFGDELEMGEDIRERKFINGADVQQWLTNEIDIAAAQEYIIRFDVSEKADLIQTLISQFYDMIDEPMTESRDLEKLAGAIFDSLPEALKEGASESVPAIREHFGEINEIIKKIAQKNISKKKTFNLKKTAQHKTLENTILWGPSQSRKVDPFSRQPVSDWHIVERNKGFGLVVDDIWNIDYETIWRENIMDKYSRSYRDKNGNWVGGYIQKRFEVDKNIPETSNYQLKPGQIRRPIVPEYGNIESRLQAAKAKGEIAGSPVVDKTGPFNWKEANKKKSLVK